MARVFVLGNSGAGKSHLSAGLGKALGLPVTHLDQLYWGPGSTPTPGEDWERKLSAAALKEQWIIDGKYFGPEEVVAWRADAILFLDVPVEECVKSALERGDGGVGRPEGAAPGWASERFIGGIRRFDETQRPGIEDMMAHAQGAGKFVATLEGRAAADALLEDPFRVFRWIAVAGAAARLPGFRAEAFEGFSSLIKEPVRAGARL